jgi:transposase
MEQEMSALWTFVVEEGVEPTNNRVEPTNNRVERILSLRKTCRLRGIPTFPVLVDAVTCYFGSRYPDVSWI